jgi:hypothetical protein
MLSACLLAAIFAFLCESAVGQQLQAGSLIALSESAAVGEVSAADRNANGDLLVVDHIGNAVYVFGQRGQLLSELDPRGCGISYRFRPIYARFIGEEILVVNSDPWGLRFDHRGRCLGTLSAAFEAPAEIAISGESDVFGYFPWDGTVKSYSRNGSVVSSFATPEFRYPNAAARVEGGGIAVVGEELFVAEPFATEILVLNRDGRLLRTIDLHPLGLATPASDLGEGSAPEAMREAANLVSTASVIVMIAEVVPGVLLVQYRHPDRSMGIALFDADGRLLGHDPTFRNRIMYAGNGVALTVDQPDVDDRGYLPNPQFTTHTFNR